MLQSVTECYTVLQSVTKYYRVLQSITEYYRLLQSITKYYNDKSNGSTWANFWACFFKFQMSKQSSRRGSAEYVFGSIL